MNYEEKINSKIEYAENKATELKANSEEFFKKGFCEQTGIPIGQPILRGHHSENRHRNAIKKYENKFNKAIENGEKADYYKNKAERLKNGSVISSDNPKAINLLKDKIKGLEISLNKSKILNAKLRTFKDRKNALIEIEKLEDSEEKTDLKEMLNQAKYYAIPPERINAYYLNTTSHNAEIRRLKERIKELEHKSNISEVKETINGVILKVDKEENRLKLFFDGKPSEEIRTKLKGFGYRWSGLNKCWQCFLHDWKITQAKEFLKELV